MEGRLKRADQRRVGQQRPELADGGDIGRIVRGRDGVERRHFCQHILRQVLHARDAPRVNDLEANAVQRGKLRQDAVQQRAQHPFDGLAMCGEYGFLRMLLAGEAVFRVEASDRRADTLYAAGGQNVLAAVEIKKLIFQGGASDVADQNFHGNAPCFHWYPRMAARPAVRGCTFSITAEAEKRNENRRAVRRSACRPR